MTEILVHIGAPKTGSTAAQRFLFENRQGLAERGVVYPDVSLRGWGHHDLAFLLSGGYPAWATPQPRTLEELADDLRRVLQEKPRRLVISSEDFYLLPNPRRLADLLRACGDQPDPSVRILVYIRRQDDAHLSWYNQMVKAQGYAGTLAEAVEACFDLWDYRRNLALWADVFGRDRLIVRRFEPSKLVGGDIRRDVIDVLGLDHRGFVYPAEEVNTGLLGEVLEFQRLINRLPLPAERLRSRHRDLMELSRLARGTGLLDERPLLDEAGRAALLGRYAQSNAAVAKDYFDGEPLFAASEPRAGRAAPTSEAPAVSPEGLATILAWLLLQP